MTFMQIIPHSGIPTRAIIGAVGHIPGASVLKKMRCLAANDHAGQPLELDDPLPNGCRVGDIWA